MTKQNVMIDILTSRVEMNLSLFAEEMENEEAEEELPASFEEMKTLAAMLSEGMAQVRVDFYEIDGKIYFRADRRIAPGSFVKVRIREVLDYDLVGRALSDQKD